MFSWLRDRLWLALPTPKADVESLAEDRESKPVWVDDILDAVQKVGRAGAKQSARVESMLGEIDESVRSVAQLARRPATGDPLQLDEVFDALDALDAALGFLTEPNSVEGLRRVHERLTRFCERAGYTRVAALGAVPDPRIMRVVGIDDGSPDGGAGGAISRVVRGAITRDGRLVREGEVIVMRGGGV